VGYLLTLFQANQKEEAGSQRTSDLNFYPLNEPITFLTHLSYKSEWP